MSLVRARGGQCSPLLGTLLPWPALPASSGQRSRAPGMAGPVVWAPTPGPPLGRPPSALRARLKTNRPGNCGGQPRQPAREGSCQCQARLRLAAPRRGHTCGPPAPSVFRLPGLLGWGQALEERGVITCGPIRPWREDGWMGWGVGGPKQAREGRAKT